MNAWLYHGYDYDKSLTDRYINALQDFELECETMSIHTILENDLSVNVVDYIKQANAYIYFYNLVRDERKWCKYAPYTVNEILDMMPEQIITDPRDISEEIYEMIKIKCL